MQGENWESVIEVDTRVIIGHTQIIGNYFHQSFYIFKPEILFTGKVVKIHFSQKVIMTFCLTL